MKRIIRVLLLLIILLIPIRISALSVQSELIDVSKMEVNITLGEVILKNVTFVSYNNYQNTKVKGYVVNSGFVSDYDKEVEVKMIFKLYDASKNEIKSFENNYKLVQNKTTLFEIGEQYPNVDAIKYYSVYLEMLTDVSVPKKEDLNTDYYIDNMDSSIVITEGREAKYNEKLSVKYERGSNYFNYTLPVKDIYLLNNLIISDSYTKELDNGINKIRIGDKKKKYTDFQEFNIAYEYNMGKDYNRGKDVLDLDLLNTYSTLVKKANFDITLPKNEIVKNITFYVDGKEEKVDYRIKGNKITGNYRLVEHDKILSVKIEFSDKYFTKSQSIIDKWIILGLIIPITSLLITLILFLLIRDKRIMSRKVDMNLINKYSSLEVGYLYNDKLDNKDVISMILSLANKGYINIEKSNKGFILKKNKEYEGENEFEKDFLEGIFYENSMIKEEELYYMDNNFMKDIKSNIEYKYKNKFYNNYLNKYIILVLACYLSIFVITYRPLVVYDHTNLLLGVSLSLIVFTIIFIILNSRFKMIERIIGYLCVLAFYSIMTYLVIIPSLAISNIYAYIYFIGILCIAGNLLLYRLIPKRKMASNKLLRNVNRLKKNIDSNKIVNEQEFLLLLPYTYVMDCYDKYTSINVCKEVSWYEDSNYVYWEFIKDIKTLLANITYDLTHDNRNGVNK